MLKNNKSLNAILALIKYPLITKKAQNLAKIGKYTFIVSPKLNKIDLKNAFEKSFNVQVQKVNTLRVPPKFKKVNHFKGLKAKTKKVIITLKTGFKINNIFNYDN